MTQLIQNLSAKEVLNYCYDLASIVAKKKNIDLTLDISHESDIIIFADNLEITRVINNIVSNAIKFTPKGGSIQIKLFKKDKWAHFSFQDSGVGIPDNVLNNLFKKQHSTKGTEGEVGTGLGLYLVNEIVKSYNGEVHVESEKGDGTLFLMKLPLN